MLSDELETSGQRAYSKMFLSFFFLMIFFGFSKQFSFLVFPVQLQCIVEVLQR